MHVVVLIFVLLAFVGAGMFVFQMRAASAGRGAETGNALVGAVVGAAVFLVGVVGLFVTWAAWLMH